MPPKGIRSLKPLPAATASVQPVPAAAKPEEKTKINIFEPVIIEDTLKTRGLTLILSDSSGALIEVKADIPSSFGVIANIIVAPVKFHGEKFAQQNGEPKQPAVIHTFSTRLSLRYDQLLALTAKVNPKEALSTYVADVKHVLESVIRIIRGAPIGGQMDEKCFEIKKLSTILLLALYAGTEIKHTEIRTRSLEEWLIRVMELPGHIKIKNIIILCDRPLKDWYHLANTENVKKAVRPTELNYAASSFKIEALNFALGIIAGSIEL